MAAVACAAPLVRAAVAVAVACTAAAAATSSSDSSSGSSGVTQWAFPAALTALLLPPRRRRPHPPRSQTGVRDDDSAALPHDSASIPTPPLSALTAAPSSSAAQRLSFASASQPADWPHLPSTSRSLVWLLLLLVCVDQCGAMLPRDAMSWLHPLLALSRAALAALTLALAVHQWWHTNNDDASPSGPPSFRLAPTVPSTLAHKEATVSPLLSKCCLPEAPPLIAAPSPALTATAAKADAQSTCPSSSPPPLPAAVQADQATWLLHSQPESTTAVSSAVPAHATAVAALQLSASAPVRRTRASTAPPSPISASDESTPPLATNAPLTGALNGASSASRTDRCTSSDNSPTDVSPPVSVSPLLRTLDSSGAGRLISNSGRALLRLKEKLRALDAEHAKQEQENARGRMFMACLCHELRNPLQVISANADFLLEDADEAEAVAAESAAGGDTVSGASVPPLASSSSGVLSADQRELITSINASAELMLSIVNDVLDMSRLQSGRMSFERLPLDLHWSCHSILNISRSQAASKGLRLELNIDEAVPRFVISDPTRIHQLLLNLISNAIKFTSSGSVTLTLRLAQLQSLQEEDGIHSPVPKDGPLLLPEMVASTDATTSDSSSGSSSTASVAADTAAAAPSDSSEPPLRKALIEMEVRDTGVGIAPENIGKLFTPFAQANSSTGREHGGSGLGLSICTQIVKNMAGTIAVSSELGKGSRFTTRLLLDVCDDESIRRGLGTSAGSYSNSPNLRRMIDAQNDATAAAAAAAAAAHTGGEVPAAPSGLDSAAVTPSSPAAVPSPERLLIVDDQPVNIKLLQRMLSSLGFQIDVAHNGAEAIAKIKACGYVARSTVDGETKEATCAYLCCFLDLQMPVMNGWQCVSHIRQQLQLSSLPVIALTAQSLEPTKATDAGFTMALAKPFRKPALLDILEPLLEAKRRAALAPSIAPTAPNSAASTPEIMHCTSNLLHSASDSGSSDAGDNQPAGVGTPALPAHHHCTSSSSTPSPTADESAAVHVASPLCHPSASTPDPSALPTSPHQTDQQKVEGALNAILHATKLDQNSAIRSDQPLTLNTESSEQVASPASSTLVAPQSMPAALSSLSRANLQRHIGFGELVNEESVALDSSRDRPSLTRPLSVSRGSERDGAQPSAHSVASLASSSPPLRPSHRQRMHEMLDPSTDPSSVECTPSSHRRSIRPMHAVASSSAEQSDSSSSDTPPPMAPQRSIQPSQHAQPNGVSRLRGGGTHSPLGLTASPRTVARHLVIEPASYPGPRRAANANRDGSGPCSPFNNGSVASSASMSSISDSILSSTSVGQARSTLSGYHSSAENDLVGRSQRRPPAPVPLPPRCKSSSMGQMDLQSIAPTHSSDHHAAIPPLHPPPSHSVPLQGRSLPSPSPSLPSPSPSPAHSCVSAMSHPASVTSEGATEEESNSPLACTSARSSPTRSVEPAFSGEERRQDCRSAQRLSLTAPANRSQSDSLSDVVDDGGRDRDYACKRSNSDGLLTRPQTSSRSSSEGSITPSIVAALIAAQEPHSALTSEEAERAKRAADKQRQQQAASALPVGLATSAPLDSLANMTSPPPLLAPPCTPLSPQRDDGDNPMVTVAYPNLDWSVQQFAYPRPFPSAVFRGAANATPPMTSATPSNSNRGSGSGSSGSSSGSGSARLELRSQADPQAASTTDTAHPHSGSGTATGSESDSEGSSPSPPPAQATSLTVTAAPNGKSRAVDRSNRRSASLRFHKQFDAAADQGQSQGRDRNEDQPA